MKDEYTQLIPTDHRNMKCPQTNEKKRQADSLPKRNNTNFHAHSHTHTHMQNALEINERTKNQSKSRMNSTYQMTSYFQSDNTGFIRVGAGQPLIPSKVNSRVAFLLAKEIKRFSRCYVL